MTYDAYLESPDEFTRIPTLAGYVPLHRIAMNDAAGTEYYVSEKSNEIVQRTDRRSRILAISGYVLHNLFFFRQRTWWTPLLDFIAWTAMLMVVTGYRRRNLARGAQAAISSQRCSVLHTLLRLDEVAPLCRPDLWLVFDLLDPQRDDPHQHVPDSRVDRGVQSALKATARDSSWGIPPFLQVHDDEGDGARHHGRPLELATAPDRKRAECHRADPGKVRSEGSGTHPVSGEPYFLAYQPPTTQAEAEHWTTNNAINSVNLPQDNPHLFVSISHPENGVMTSFSREVMEQASREAMPNVPVIAANG